MRTLSETIAANALTLGDKPCIILPTGQVALSYRQLDNQATMFAGFLAALGCSRGDRLLIAVHNTPEFFVALLGAMRAEVVAIPIDSNLAAPELLKIAEHADPYAVVVNERSASKLANLSVNCKRIAIGATSRTGEVLFDPNGGDISFAVGRPTNIQDLTTILYTSGTTGMPKGVMHSHASLATKLETIEQWFSFDSSFRSLCLLPTHFGHGLICNCLSTLYYGGTLVLCQPFDLDLIRILWKYVEENNVNTFSTVPAVIRLLLGFAGRGGPVRVPSLKFVTCASAPLRAEDIQAFENCFGVPLLNCYGITETASWTAFSPRGHERDLSSVGIGHGCDIRAAGPEGNPLPPDESGELQIRGPSVMLGYYKNPELTEQTIVDGWFRTGDLGKVDSEGRVYILGRIKELIIRAGLNVYPADIDTVLLSHPDIEEAYCVGLKDTLLDEKVAAVIVRKAGSNLDERGVIAFCRDRLAQYKCPERIAFVTAIPKTSRGKVNRDNLRSLF